jgi:hypothetical protein
MKEPGRDAGLFSDSSSFIRRSLGEGEFPSSASWQRRTIEQWAAGIGALFFETGKYRQTGGTESRNRKILSVE